MPYYKDTNNGLHFLEDTTHENLLPVGSVQISDEDAAAIQAANGQPETSSIPQVVSAAQGGIALIQAGFMADVQSVIDAPETPAEIKWAWARATEWHRDSPAMAYIAPIAGISEAQMDELFIAAGRILP